MIKKNAAIDIAEGKFNHTGGKLHVERYGCTMHIPDGALETGVERKISLQVLTELPDDLVLQEDEVMVSYGFHCSPSGLRFKNPVTITLQHCVTLRNAQTVDAVIYWKSRLG